MTFICYKNCQKISQNLKVTFSVFFSRSTELKYPVIEISLAPDFRYIQNEEFDKLTFNFLSST